MQYMIELVSVIIVLFTALLFTAFLRTSVTICVSFPLIMPTKMTGIELATTSCDKRQESE